MGGALKSGFQISRRNRLLLLVLATMTCGVMAVAGAIAAIFTPLVFDAPGSLFNPIAWLGFVLCAGFWVVCLLAPLVAWIQWRRGREPIAWASMAAPLAWAAATLAVLQFVPA
ncbi:hypothetical protein [Caulobacter soli]|uniref:hypothetical protein n=1 Tax=Caulobacter soli TaxID=2708539 RepID=UPI001FE5F03C|nr:hypothetical protein [Caulobacter soli]